MATTKKRITIHPVSGSTVDQTVDMYPKTTIDQLYDEDGETPYEFKVTTIEYDADEQALKITTTS